MKLHRVIKVIAVGSRGAHFDWFGIESSIFRTKIVVVNGTWRFEEYSVIIIQHIDTLPKYGQKTPDVRRST